MTAPRKVVGQAVALKKGEYVRPDGSTYWVQEGDVFDLVEGLEKSRWFTRVQKGAAPVLPKPDATEVPGMGPKRGSRVKVDVTGDDIA